MVILAVHDTRNICLNPFISNVSIRDSLAVLMVQPSHPYVATGHTKTFSNQTLVSMEILIYATRFSYYYTVFQKNVDYVFDDKLNYNCLFTIIFGTLITKTIT